MKIFGQPADYSEILQRIFYTSVASGLLCTILLANASPAVQNILNLISTEADLGPLKGIKALYVLIPLGIGFISRMLKLHDKISNVFRIRYRFDTEYILFPLAEGAGITLDNDTRMKIRARRVDSMYAVFYRYAGFKDPVIDGQLVRTAADNWAWFWVLIESSFLFLVTACFLAYLGSVTHVLICVTVIVAQLLFTVYFWLACRKSSRPQVQAILADPSRKGSVASYFQGL